MSTVPTSLQPADTHPTDIDPTGIDPIAANVVPSRRRTERGMTTAEYAVGTVAAASFAGVLIKILTDPALQTLLLSLIQAVLELFMRVTPL